MRAVVGGVDDDRVVGDAEVVQGLEDLADWSSCSIMPSMYSLSPCCVLAAVLGADVRAQVHARGVEPAEERLPGLLPLHVVDRGGGGLIVDRLHPLLGERAGVLDGLLADLAEARVFGGVVTCRWPCT